MGIGWVYGIQSGSLIKIGITSSMSQRLRAMRLHNPHPLRIVLRRRCEDCYFVERRMHKLLEAGAKGREWFTASPDQVREAYKVAHADMRVHLLQQELWERESAERAEKRAAARGLDGGASGAPNLTS